MDVGWPPAVHLLASKEALAAYPKKATAVKVYEHAGPLAAVASETGSDGAL